MPSKLWSALPLAFAISPTSVPAFYRLRILLTPTFDKEPKIQRENSHGIVFLNAIIIARRGRAAKGKNAGLYGKNDNKKAAHLNESKQATYGRGRRTRTLNKGFGDPRVTVTPCPSALFPLYTCFSFCQPEILQKRPKNVGLQYILDKHKKGKRDRVSYAKVELPHHNSAKGDHIPHEQEYNTRHGVSAIADEVCREIRR